MAAYFFSTQLTGYIGLFSTILTILHGLSLGFLASIFIHFSHGKHLRLRIAGTSSIFSLLSELWASETSNKKSSWFTLYFFSALVIVGNAIPLIINTGMKATTTGIVRQPSTHWKYDDVDLSGYRDSGHIIQSRSNSSALLSEVYLYIAQLKGINTYSGADFIFLSEAKPVAVIGVNTNYNTALPIPNPPPGTLSLTRLLNIFSKDNTPTCDLTSPKCEITSMRTTLAPWANPNYLFHTPWKVIYNDHEGNPIIIANVSNPLGSRNVIDSHFVVERPTTVISGYTETNGISVMVAVTTASFQTQFDLDPKDGLDSFLFYVSSSFHNSEEPLYTSIYNALKASIPAQPHNRTVASNNVTLVYSTSSASSDNSTHISCVLYEAEVLGPNHRTYVWDMVSCREFHITARSNTGATRSANSDYIDNEDYTMFTIFDAVSKPPKTDYLNYMSDHYDMTRIAILSADLLKNLAERMYPFMADYTGIVQPWEYRSGISVEKWTVVFIGTLIGLMVVTAVVERFLVEDIWRADVLTLIENSTKEYTSKKQWKKHYPEWSVVQVDGSYQVRLRGETVRI